MTYRERDTEIVQSGIGQLGVIQENGIVQAEFKNAYYLKNPEKTVSTGSFNDNLLKIL
jgi:hypothetical protein